MATFYFIRHGQMDMSMAEKKFYKGFAFIIRKRNGTDS